MMDTQKKVIASLPSHLRPFAAYQNYSLYTPRDQAIWRFLLHQLHRNLHESAHPTYFEGLKKTGITLESIPRIEEINQFLNQLGWRAVVVDGFLPPAIFMEFQALKVLVIAVNIRSFEHMLYTPAPDIIHESAGHAPFLIDVDYAEFLQHFGELGMRAIASKEDLDVYEAIRKLSIEKERPDATPKEIASAEQQLVDANARNIEPSEAALLARLHWWTVEYGLVGNREHYQIFGAGLLSSLGESVSCLDDTEVEKRSLTVDAIGQAYDITTEQPLLYITESCRHLSQVLAEFGRSMCHQKGGTDALELARRAATVNTCELNSGVQLSGVVDEFVTDAVDNCIYLRLAGSCQISFAHQQLHGFGPELLNQGIEFPIGKLRSIERCPSTYTMDELKRHHIEVDKNIDLHYLSGIHVQGVLRRVVRRNQANMFFVIENCRVTSQAQEVLFESSKDDYIMPIGCSVESIFGGSADQNTYPLYPHPSDSATVVAEYDAATNHLFDLYQKLRDSRQSENTDGDIQKVIESIIKMDDADWLLIYEAMEQIENDSFLGEAFAELEQKLLGQLATAKAEKKILIEYALGRFEN